MFYKIVLIFALCYLLTSCDSGKNMMKPMITDIASETATEEDIYTIEPELPTIGFDVEAEVPTLPGDVEILPADDVFPSNNLVRVGVKLNDDGQPDVNGKLHVYDPFIFDDALSALTDDGVLTFFDWVEAKVEHYCTTSTWIYSLDLEVAGEEGVVDGGAVDAVADRDIDNYPSEDMHVHFTQRSEADKFISQIDVDAGPWGGGFRRYVTVLNNEKVYFVVVIAAFQPRNKSLCLE